VHKEHKRMDMIQTEEKMEFQPVSPQKPPSESDLPAPSNEQATKKNLTAVNLKQPD